jgi:hypothetical protein
VEVCGGFALGVVAGRVNPARKARVKFFGMFDMDNFILPLNFVYKKGQRIRFKNGELWRYWAEKYKGVLFDKDDCRLCGKSGGAGRGYYFFEWLGAVLLYEATGYRSLVMKYGCGNHSEKMPVYNKLMPDSLPDVSGYPDLFVYAPDLNDFYFCEVKGGKDKLRPHQVDLYKKIYKITGEPVRVLTLTEY